MTGAVGAASGCVGEAAASVACGLADEPNSAAWGTAGSHTGNGMECERGKQWLGSEAEAWVAVASSAFFQHSSDKPPYGIAYPRRRCSSSLR